MQSCLTRFFGGRTQPGLRGIVKPAVVPQVRVLHALPLPPGLQRQIRRETHGCTCAQLRDKPSACLPNMSVTFSMVAMNSIARVMRCSRVTNMSRYAIFNSLPTQTKNRRPDQLHSGKQCVTILTGLS